MNQNEFYLEPEFDLERLNSATKYPSILTFHRLGDRGVPTDDVQVDFEGARPIYTEKIDGTNARIITYEAKAADGFLWQDYFIGSREELLTAYQDRVPNPAMGIVAALRTIADSAPTAEPGSIVVYYLEIFGGNVTAGSKQYTGERQVGCRLFDVAMMPFEILARERTSIAAWRDGGGQTFRDEAGLAATAAKLGVALTPRIEGPDVLPSNSREIAAVLQEMLPRTRVALDDGAGSRPEGIVARLTDRSRIAKLRFEDYARLDKRGREKKT